MPASTHTPLGASTVNRKWYIDVNTGTTGSPTWVPVMGINNLVPNFDNPSMQDDSDFDSGGFGSDTKTMAKWSAQFNALRKVLTSDSTSYDPGQEFLRSKAIGQFGPSNQVQIRIYEMEPSGPREEAYLGQAAVQWQDQGGGNDGLSVVQVTLSGQGELEQITHPDTGSAIPVVSGIDDSTLAAAGGDLVTISGNRFTGATAVHFGATAATAFHVISDGLISAVAPAHAAGVVAVKVTNAIGQSTTSASATYA